MTERLEQPARGGRTARPSGRRYFLWQAGMWTAILHVGLLAPIAAWSLGNAFRFGGFETHWRVALATIPVHIKVAYWLAAAPNLPATLCTLLDPLAVLGCHLAAAGRRGRGWLLAYWLATGVLCLLAIAGAGVLSEAGQVRAGPSFLFDWHADLSEILIRALLYFLPLPVTLVVAVLARQGRKDPELRRD
jgi:hypothetical protein